LEFDLSSGLGLLLVAAIVLANAFFVLSEYALVASRRAVLVMLSEEGSRRAASALRLKDTPLRFIGTSQLGVTVASIVLGAVGEPLFAHFFSTFLTAGLAVAVGLLIITYVHVTVGELTPKAVALTHPERMALWCAWPLEGMFRLTRPLVFILHRSASLFALMLGVRQSDGPRQVSEKEVRLMLGAAGDGGAIEEAEEEMALKVLDFGDKEAADVMALRPDVCLLRASWTVREALVQAAGLRHICYPVIGEDQDDLVGFVDIRDLLAAVSSGGLDEVRLSELMKPIHSVPETKNLLDLLSEFQGGSSELAAVIDEYGQLSGVVSLADLMEEIIGEVSDAELLARQPVSLGDGKLAVSGQFSIEEFNEKFGQRLPGEDYRTISGFVFGELGHVPRIGDEVFYEEACYRVLAMNGARIEKLEVSLPPRDPARVAPIPPANEVRSRH
jgi:putative hemolysin